MPRTLNDDDAGDPAFIDQTLASGRSREEELRIFVDTIPVAAWCTSADGMAEFFNKHHLEYVGRTSESMIGVGFLSQFHPDDVQPLIDKWQYITASRVAGEHEGRVRRADGAYRWHLMRATPLLDDAGKVIRWYGVLTDIEDRKATEDAIKSAEKALAARLQEIISTVPALAWSADDDGYATFLNQNYLNYIGLELESALGLGWLEYIHPDDTDRLQLVWKELRDVGRGGDAEARLRNKAGEYRWFLIRSNPLCDASGRVVQWFGINIDIEDRKRAEANLRQSRADLAHVSRVMTMGELVVSIAHEINQPLMAIVTNAATCLRWLREDQLDLGEARRSVERIVRDGHRAGDVVASIRASAKKIAPTFLVLDMHTVIRDVLHLLGGELDRHGIEPTLSFSHENAAVLGDVTQLQQVILNLVMNAVEALASGESIPPALEIGCTRSDNTVRVTVSDNGTGFDPQAASRLFASFYTTKPDGIGMGLSICRSIIEGHGGKIWAAPGERSGSVFSFTLPSA